MHSDFNGFPALQPNWRDFGIAVGQGGALYTTGLGIADYTQPTTPLKLPEARGIGAVDLQTGRINSSEVVSGRSSFAAGLGNTVTGKSSIALGRSNAVFSDDSVAFGAANVVESTGGAALGAVNTVDGPYSVAIGYYAKTTGSGQFAQAYGAFADAGDAQASVFVMRNSTSNATPTELFIGSGSERCGVSSDTTWFFDIHLVARRTDADDESAAYRFEGCIDRNASAASTALVGSVTKTVLAEDTAAWDADVDADTTNGALRITVTGEAAKTIRWVAFVRTVEVAG